MSTENASADNASAEKTALLPVSVEEAFALHHRTGPATAMDDRVRPRRPARRRRVPLDGGAWPHRRRNVSRDRARPPDRVRLGLGGFGLDPEPDGSTVTITFEPDRRRHPRPPGPRRPHRRAGRQPPARAGTTSSPASNASPPVASAGLSPMTAKPLGARRAHAPPTPRLAVCQQVLLRRDAGPIWRSARLRVRSSRRGPGWWITSSESLQRLAGYGRRRGQITARATPRVSRRASPTPGSRLWRRGGDTASTACVQLGDRRAARSRSAPAILSVELLVHAWDFAGGHRTSGCRSPTRWRPTSTSGPNG